MTWKQNESRNPTLVLSKEALVIYEGFFLSLEDHLLQPGRKSDFRQVAKIPLA